MPARRSSFTKRSCRVLTTRSIWPVACARWACIIATPSSFRLSTQTDCAAPDCPIASRSSAQLAICRSHDGPCSARAVSVNMKAVQCGNRALVRIESCKSQEVCIIDVCHYHTPGITDFKLVMVRAICWMGSPHEGFPLLPLLIGLLSPHEMCGPPAPTTTVARFRH